MVDDKKSQFLPLGSPFENGKILKNKKQNVSLYEIFKEKWPMLKFWETDP